MQVRWTRNSRVFDRFLTRKLIVPMISLALLALGGCVCGKVASQGGSGFAGSSSSGDLPQGSTPSVPSQPPIPTPPPPSNGGSDTGVAGVPTNAVVSFRQRLLDNLGLVYGRTQPQAFVPAVWEMQRRYSDAEPERPLTERKICIVHAGRTDTVFQRLMVAFARIKR